MLNRAFSRTEEILMLVLVVILLGLLYYQFVYKAQQDAILQYDTTDLEIEIQTQTARAAQIRSMQEEIEKNKGEGTGVVETYDNLKQEINELNDIFADATDFDFGFDQAQAEGDAVRRVITASFGAPSYARAKEMLTALHDCPYRCLITDLTITPDGTGADETNLNSGAVRVSFSVTFYETLYNAKSTDGLKIDSSGTDSSGQSLLDDLQASRDSAQNAGQGQ